MQGKKIRSTNNISDDDEQDDVLVQKNKRYHLS